MAKVGKKSKTGRPLLAGALFCEKILEEKDNVLSVIRIVDVITLPKPPDLPPGPEGQPAPVPIAQLLAFLSFKSGDAKGESLLQLSVVMPSGKRQPASTSTPMTFLGGNHGVIVRAPVFAPVAEEGLYWYEVRVDGRLLVGSKRQNRVVVATYARDRPHRPRGQPAPQPSRRRHGRGSDSRSAIATRASRATRQSAVALNLARYLDRSREERSWNKEELAMLGTKPDEVIAEEIGRSVNGVRVKRTRLRIANPCDRRGR
jgi:hypothetical protein